MIKMDTKFCFEPVSFQNEPVVRHYMESFGENSCQHSFTSMFSLYEKYGDSVCERDGFLYVWRKHLSREGVRVYLAPMGDGDFHAAYARLMEDAHACGQKVALQTVSQAQKDIIESLFPDKFAITESRDDAEYLYTSQKLATLPGKKLVNKRHDANHYWRTYGPRTQVTRITQADFSEVWAFEQKWLKQCWEDHDRDALQREARTIEKQLEHFDRLRISGIVLRLDGEVRGFGYGTPISDSCYDALIEKGDREIQHIYRVLNQEAVKQCAMDYTYVNREEDVGVQGLRASKLAYQPDLLLKKYRVIEK